MNELKQRWQQFSQRERGLMVGCGVLLMLCLGYYALWQPWQQQAAEWQRTIAREQNTVAWMAQQAPRLSQQTPRSTPVEARSLSATITSSAAAQSIQITRLQPQGERLAVTLEPNDFDALMQWLTQLEQQYSVHILAFEVVAQADKPGWVTVDKLVLEHSSGGS
jgi:general secretion pathway protein M